MSKSYIRLMIDNVKFSSREVGLLKKNNKILLIINFMIICNKIKKINKYLSSFVINNMLLYLYRRIYEYRY